MIWHVCMYNIQIHGCSFFPFAGLIWTLILHYQVRLVRTRANAGEGTFIETKLSPKQFIAEWLNDYVGGVYCCVWCIVCDGFVLCVWCILCLCALSGSHIFLCVFEFPNVSNVYAWMHGHMSACADVRVHLCNLLCQYSDASSQVRLIMRRCLMWTVRRWGMEKCFVRLWQRQNHAHLNTRYDVWCEVCVVMTWWRDDVMTWWCDDVMMWWCDDVMMWWCDVMWCDVTWCDVMWCLWRHLWLLLWLLTETFYEVVSEDTPQHNLVRGLFLIQHVLDAPLLLDVNDISDETALDEKVCECIHQWDKLSFRIHPHIFTHTNYAYCSICTFIQYSFVHLHRVYSHHINSHHIHTHITHSHH